MSNSITRTYTFANGGIADGGQVDSEIANIVNTINNADAGTTTWTQVKAATLTSTTSTILKGSSTNDSASAGNIGEYIESIPGSANFGASGVFSDYTSISLTAGDWDVSFLANGDPASVGTFTNFDIGISTTTGNSTTGLTSGSNRLTIGATTASDTSGCIPVYRMSLASTTTVYAKMESVYSGGSGAPRIISGRLSARRVR